MRKSQNILAATAALCVASGAEAAPRCPDPLKLFPGIELGAEYSKVASAVPRSAGCQKVSTVDGCEFIDKYGILNVFTQHLGNTSGSTDRLLFERTLIRARGGPLPYGVTWSDSYREVAAKLRPHGGRPSAGAPEVLWVPGCNPGFPNNYWLDFRFDKAGRLSEVSLGFHVI